MFDNSDYEVPVTYPVFSLEGLAAWLETQPGKTEYCYTDTGGCLLFQYYTARGLPVFGVGGHGAWLDFDDVMHGNLYSYDGEIGRLGEIAVGRPRTFSAALTRCHEAMQS